MNQSHAVERSRRARRLGRGLVLMLPLVGCTVANPDFESSDQGTQRRDQAVVVRDVGLSDRPDRHPDQNLPGDGGVDRTLPDLYPTPDTEPWHCQTGEDCTDNLDCTEDICDEQQRCANPVDPAHCLILGVCRDDEQENPDTPCQVCAPETSQTSWTPRSDWVNCTDDDAWCTEDICISGKCEHLVEMDTCFIGGVCAEAGDPNPANSCEECRPWDCAVGWCPVYEDMACEDDGLWCTDDVCQSGVCMHLALFGCQINGECYSDDQENPADPCQECIPSRSTTAFTFIDGKECYSATGLAGICVHGTCRSLVEETYEPVSIGPSNSDYTTTLSGVAHIPSASQVWAVGHFESSFGTGGVMIALDKGSTLPILTLRPFRGIHYRLAVGDEGSVWHHNGSTWLPQATIEAALNSNDRTSVWGAPINGVDTFFLAGYQLSSEPGVLACVDGPGGFSCTEHNSFDIDSDIGGIVGTLMGTGQGPLWAAPFGGPEDIYSNPGIGTTWSRDPPAGCMDYGPTPSTPCSDSNGDYRHIYASSPDDVWVVGSGGLMFHYDGQSWTSLHGVLPSQPFYTFDAVYSSPTDNLVTVAAHSTQGDGRTVSLFNYNIELQRWFGPITLVSPNENLTDEIRDIDGQNYGGLWMVGQRTKLSSGSPKPRQRGWIIQLK